MFYLAIFCPTQYFKILRVDPDFPRSNNGRVLHVEKIILVTQSAVSLMVLSSKNLLLSTLGSQITKDFVWKSKAAIHSFTLNFVRLIYLIF